MRVNDARVAEQSVVLVSIQGESARTITLTGIRFDVKRRAQPAGAVFVNPCGDNINGRSLRQTSTACPWRSRTRTPIRAAYSTLRNDLLARSDSRGPFR